MLTKSRIARKVAAEGIETIIADGRRDGILPDLLAARSRDVVCTRFDAPRPTAISERQEMDRQHSEGFAKGELHVDRRSSRCVSAARAPRACSPVGVSRRRRGSSSSDDIVRILAPDGAGRSARASYPCDSATARRNLGRQGLTAADTLRLPISGIKMEYDTIFARCSARPQRAARSCRPPGTDRAACSLKAAGRLRWRRRKECSRPTPSTCRRMDSPIQPCATACGSTRGAASPAHRRRPGNPSPDCFRRRRDATLDRTDAAPTAWTLRKVRVPFGVVGMICEARPNVTADIFSLSMKTGNACVLKGGSDARRSNEAIAALLREALAAAKASTRAAFTLLPAGHEAAGALLNAVGYVDVVIPRGGAGLIRFVRENARIPVIETGAGIVHTYFDLDGDLTKGRAVVCNAKTRRVSVCNALDCLIVHRERLRDLAELCRPDGRQNASRSTPTRSAYAALARPLPAACLLRPPRRSTRDRIPRLQAGRCGPSAPSTRLSRTSPATPRSHSEAIVTENAGTAREFTRRVDAACVYVNVSTAFTDGGQFGSAPRSAFRPRNSTPRGPMGLPELTTYKYVISGNGQTREP
ncbi:MAG: gamma-glutamyl-phosphate reductase [Alistipes shahii]